MILYILHVCQSTYLPLPLLCYTVFSNSHHPDWLIIHVVKLLRQKCNQIGDFQLLSEEFKGKRHWPLFWPQLVCSLLQLSSPLKGTSSYLLEPECTTLAQGPASRRTRKTGGLRSVGGASPRREGVLTGLKNLGTRARSSHCFVFGFGMMMPSRIT